MKIVHSIDSSYIDFDRFLYNTEKYVAKFENRQSFYVIEDVNLIGVAHFFVQDNKAYSPIRAPFGSIECESEEGTKLLLGSIIDWAEKEGLEELIIKHYSLCYHGVDEKVFIENEFESTLEETNFHINITNADFESLIHPSKKRKLQKGQGFIFEIADTARLSEIYQLIVENRGQKGYPVTLSFEQLTAEIRQFPDRFILFTLKQGETLVATVIAVQVNDKVMYSFYPGDKYEYRQSSPMVYLYDCIYRYCQEHDFKVLDLGIATEDGIPNEGLMNFKTQIGGVATPKRTFVKKLT